MGDHVGTLGFEHFCRVVMHFGSVVGATPTLHTPTEAPRTVCAHHLCTRAGQSSPEFTPTGANGYPLINGTAIVWSWSVLDVTGGAGHHLKRDCVEGAVLSCACVFL